MSITETYILRFSVKKCREGGKYEEGRDFCPAPPDCSDIDCFSE